MKTVYGGHTSVIATQQTEESANHNIDRLTLVRRKCSKLGKPVNGQFIVPTTVESESGTVLSDEALTALEELSIVLKAIYIRMRKQGYKIVDGTMIKVNKNEQQDKTRSRHP